MPGPLFNFSAYLGAIIAWNAGYVFIVGTIVAWFGLFGPGVMLMFAVSLGDAKGWWLRGHPGFLERMSGRVRPALPCT